MSNQLELEHICVDIDGTRIIDDVSFSLKPGDIGCLLGPSGCGLPFADNIKTWM